MTEGAGPGAALSIRLIGGLRADCGSAAIVVRKQKAAALLAVLALAPDFEIGREEARSLLWPESDAAAGQTSLRSAVFALKSALLAGGFDGLHSDRTRLWMAPGQVQTDVDAMLGDLQEGHCATTLALDPVAVAGLDRFLPPVTDEFARRMEESARHIARQVRQRLAACAAAAGSETDRLDIRRFIAAMDPADEGAARELIACYWRTGQVANALVAYQSLWNMLDREFGEEPSPETQALIVRVKTESTGETAPADARPRIVVAPSSLGALDTEMAVMAEAARDELCANLARFREWQVFDAAVVADAGALKTADRKTYGLALTARAPDGGPVFRALLTDLSSGELLWSEVFAGTSPQLAPGNGAVADRIAAALNLHLSRAGGQAAGGASQTGAYERWVEAQGLILEFSPASWTKAERKLDELIRDYPAFSRGYSSRASIENMRQISFPGIYSTPDLHVKALRLASRAIELDPMDSRGQLAMGWSSAMSRQFDRAELAFDLAFQYNENDPWTIASSAVGLAFCDHFEASCHLLDVLHGLGFRLQPTHWSYIAATMFLGGDYEACVAASEKSEEISHDVPAWHAAALALLGRREEAAEVARSFERIARANWAVGAPTDTSEITRWLVSGFPIRNRDTWLAFRDGLRLAGMPVPDLIQSDAIAKGYQLNL